MLAHPPASSRYLPFDDTPLHNRHGCFCHLRGDSSCSGRPVPKDAPKQIKHDDRRQNVAEFCQCEYCTAYEEHDDVHAIRHDDVHKYQLMVESKCTAAYDARIVLTLRLVDGLSGSENPANG